MVKFIDVFMTREEMEEEMRMSELMDIEAAEMAKMIEGVDYKIVDIFEKE